MKTIATAVSILLLCAGCAFAQAKPKAPEAKIEYLGGLTLCANDAKALAAWYTNIFGVPVDNEYHGMYYGTLKFNGVELNLGIHPVAADCQKPPKGLALTFHVDSYDGYLAKLAAKGLTPYKQDPDAGYGKFAYFLDPEQNEVAIWGK